MSAGPQQRRSASTVAPRPIKAEATSAGPVLIIDTDSFEATRLVREFSGAGFRTAAVVSRDERLPDLLVPFVPGLLLMDPDAIREQSRTQDSIVKRARSRFPATSIVLQTARYSLADCFRCAQAGAAAYVRKPTSAAEVLALVSGHAQRQQADTAAVSPMSLARMEWEYICSVLAACRGNKTKAAAVLDIPRFTLQRKLRKNPPAR